MSFVHIKIMNMKTLIDRSDSRGSADLGWLKTHYTFSFADYYNPARVHFGALRVLNDDWIAPGRGFDTHPHKNMEVITIPLKGKVTHGDSLQHSESIVPGEIQVMSTGSGILHSEFNGSDSEVLELLQIWVIPNVANTTPFYRNYDIRRVDKKNKFGYIIAPDGKASVSILQDAWFSLGELDKGAEVTYQLHGARTGGYCFVIEGKIKIGDTVLSRRDGMGISEAERFQVEALEDAYVLLMEVAMI